MNEFNVSGFATGCLKPTKDLRDYKLNRSVAFAFDLPDEFKVIHSDIKNQGMVCSRVAHSVCEVLEASNNNEEKYSTNWVYGYRPRGYFSGRGMSTRQAIKTVCSVGYMLYDDFSGNTEMNEVKDIVDRNINLLKEKAKERKAYSYALLTNRNEIKKAIYMTGNPVVICVRCCSPFELDEDGVLKYSDKFDGYHAMVCYGWNEKGLLIQNSWGTNWGINGTCILPNNYPLSESWVITRTEDEYLVVRPKLYRMRKFVQSIVDFFKEIFTDT